MPSPANPRSLPYTVKFEVGAEAAAAPKPQAYPSAATPQSIIPGETPPLAPQPAADAAADAVKAEDFFRSRRRDPPASGTASAADSALLLIQPRPRNVAHPKSTLIDPKRKNEEFGLPSLRINRLQSNLLAASSSTNLAGRVPPAAAAAARRPVGAAGATFTLNHNSSTGLLPERASGVKEIDADDWDNNYNDLIDGRAATKLAPYGGFSNPGIESDILGGGGSIFDTAPWKVVFAEKGNTLLSKAVKILTAAGIMGAHKWVGTIAMPSDLVLQRVIGDISAELSAAYHCETVFPDDETFQGHYKLFCKQILWPTLHYQVPDDPKLKAFEAHSWDQYKAVNQMIADKAVEVYLRENGADADAGDAANAIWVHDYHLLLVPKMIRDRLPQAKIGFFMHVLFPLLEIFRVFAERRQLLEGMLGANCVLMQTDEYVRHFAQTCLRLLLADTSDLGITYNGRFTLVNTIPVGIDVPLIERLLEGEGVLEWRAMIRERWGKQKLLVLRDKLDRLRGIKPKLLAYERLLRARPELVERTVFIQICIGLRQDADYEAEIMQIVARINLLADNISVLPPVIFLQQDIEFEQYLALQCELDVFVVSSMREGLNLTCHEFIVATLQKHSPLVLSEFTGLLPLLECGGHGAVLINPWDLRQLALALERLLAMGAAEKEQRWRHCFDIVRKHDLTNWVRHCLATLDDAWGYDQRLLATVKPLTKEVFGEFYAAGGKRLIFLNLESPAGDDGASRDALLEPGRILLALNDLLLDRDNHVYLILYLRRADLDNLYRVCPNLGLIAENGGYIRLVGAKSWILICDDDELKLWMPQVKELIESKVVRLPGLHIEVEDCTIRFHPGRAYHEDRRRALDVMGDCIQHINDVFQALRGIHATLIRNVVIVQQHQLTLQLLQFVLSYYNSSVDGWQYKRVASARRLLLLPLQQPPLPVLPLPLAGDKVSALFVAGGSTLIDEPGFEYANDLHAGGEIARVLTVAVAGDDARTLAAYGVVGKNVLLGLLASVGE